AGNAARSDILKAANVAGAERLILAIPNAFEAGQIIDKTKAVNPGIRVIARAHSDAEVDHLTVHGADIVIMGEREIAKGILDHAAKATADDAGGDAAGPAAA
ncbi:MAG: NAD-binding protein, partial [Phreatobacter sp.]